MRQNPAVIDILAHIKKRLNSWGKRLVSLSSEKTTVAEIMLATWAIMIGVQFMASTRIMTSPEVTLFDKHLGHMYLGDTLLVSGILTIIGYLDDNDRLRTYGGLGQVAFWFYTATLLLFRFPFYYGPWLHLWIAVSCVYTTATIGRVTARRMYRALIEVIHTKPDTALIKAGDPVPGVIVYRKA